VTLLFNPVQRRSGPQRAQTLTLRTLTLGAFCVKDVNEAPHNSEAFLIFRDIEVMASLNRDTMVKAFNRIETIVKMAAPLSNKFKNI